MLNKVAYLMNVIEMFVEGSLNVESFDAGEIYLYRDNDNIGVDIKMSDSYKKILLPVSDKALITEKALSYMIEKNSLGNF